MEVIKVTSPTKASSPKKCSPKKTQAENIKLLWFGWVSKNTVDPNGERTDFETLKWTIYEEIDDDGKPMCRISTNSQMLVKPWKQGVHLYWISNWLRSTRQFLRESFPGYKILSYYKGDVIDILIKSRSCAVFVEDES